MMELTSGAIQFANPSELSLLRAALLEGQPAAEAATSWRSQLPDGEAQPGFPGLELPSRRLLPLVYWNVKTSVPPQLRDELRLVHHEYWAENLRRFQRLQELLPWFEAIGVPTLVLKGMAISVLHYRNMALRPMSDIDILVPENRAPEVVGRLQHEGWTSVYYPPSASKARYLYRHRHALALAHPRYGALDLHWHALADATFRGADRCFWNDSVPLAVNTIQTRALNPTDQLMHACVHGFRASRVPAIRWIADAMIILRTSQMDWTRLVNLARELHVTLPLGASLSFLRTTFPTPIPGQVIEELQAVAVDRAERRYFATLHHAMDWRGLLVYSIERHRRANRHRNGILGILSLPRQLQLYYKLPHLKNLGSLAFSRLGQRIRQRSGTW